MKIPLICFLDPTISELINDSNQFILEYLLLGFCEEQDSFLISEQTVKRKIFIDQKLYQILQYRSRESLTYPGILAGILISNIFLNHIDRYTNSSVAKYPFSVLFEN